MSNMKRPVTLSAELLKLISKKMNEDEEGKLLKIKTIESTLAKIFLNYEYNEYKIRRNPEFRLVLHALCVYENSFHKVSIN